MVLHFSWIVRQTPSNGAVGRTRESTSYARTDPTVTRSARNCQLREVKTPSRKAFVPNPHNKGDQSWHAKCISPSSVARTYYRWFPSCPSPNATPLLGSIALASRPAQRMGVSSRKRVPQQRPLATNVLIARISAMLLTYLLEVL